MPPGRVTSVFVHANASLFAGRTNRTPSFRLQPIAIIVHLPSVATVFLSTFVHLPFVVVVVLSISVLLPFVTAVIADKACRTYQNVWPHYELLWH